MNLKQINNHDVLYFENDDYWQKPVITEKQMFINLFNNNIVPYNYIAFPWASYIDNKYTRKFNDLQNAIDNEINEQKYINVTKDYFTVAQHIQFREYIEIFKKYNIKYIFTPHKMLSDTEFEQKHNVILIPISLFPAQHNLTVVTKMPKDKPYLTSFIGQCEHIGNISNIRKDIYTVFKDAQDCLIIKKPKWHYEQNVYGNDKTGSVSEDHYYKQMLINSKFSLCPLGTGPNSIRLWESLSFGSIPVILSDTLVLPQITFFKKLKYSDFLIVWQETKIGKLYEYLNSMDIDTINNMSNNCVKIYNEYFSPSKMHSSISEYFTSFDVGKINANVEQINTNVEQINAKVEQTCVELEKLKIQIEETTRKIDNKIQNMQKIIETREKDTKVILITQYYHVVGDDVEYNVKRQQEIDFCLQKNFENEFIDEIHLLLEKDYNLNFIDNKYNIVIKKVITGKRINYKDVFTYYNNCLTNSICILINSDIYLDRSIEIVKHINFNIDKLFISLNRYENNYDGVSSLLNGMEIDDANLKKCQRLIKPYQESIWSQDVWIWKNSIDNVNNKFDFNLGMVGCDNWINHLMRLNGYKIINCSKNICVNHYDRLSINNCKFGISKGNISQSKMNNKVGDRKLYLFLENINDIPDKYTTKIDNVHIGNNIFDFSMQKNISETPLNESQIISSSFSSDLCKPFNVLFNNPYYWEPKETDVNPFIQFNFANLYEIHAIDISGKPLDRNDKNHGYVTKFKISYVNLEKKTVQNDKIFNGIEINNGNYIKKMYLDIPIKCYSIKIYPIEYVNIRALKVKFYKMDYFHPDIFNFVCDNVSHFEKFRETLFDYETVNTLYNEVVLSDKNVKQNTFHHNKTILNEDIQEGICLYTYVMNRSENIYNNISTWLKQSVNQIIIIDWNSKESLEEYIRSLNDDRILYVRIENEQYFIRTYAQNLAYKFCKYNKIMKMDSDITLSDHFFENHLLNEGEFYVGDFRCARNDNEKYTHGNIYLYLNDYARINGYNEYIQNYGWDDSDFTIRLMLCGLTKKMFNMNYFYHVPHDDINRTVNLNTKEMHSLLMTYVNKTCIKNIIWNKNYKSQQYTVNCINKNYIVCDRIKDFEYKFDEKIYDDAIKQNTILLKSWRIL